MCLQIPLISLLLVMLLNSCTPVVQPHQMIHQLIYARVQADVAIAQTLMQQRRYTKAKAQLLRALAITPHNVAVNLQLANYYQQIKQPQQAQQIYQRVLQRQPNNTVVQWCYGDFLCQQGNTLAGLSLLQRAVQTHNAVLSAQLPISLAQCAVRARRYDLAQKAYQQAMQLAPSNTAIYLPYARLLIHQHRIKQAQRIVQAYWHLRPEDETSLKLALLIATVQADHANQAYYQLRLNSYRATHTTTPAQVVLRV